MSRHHEPCGANEIYVGNHYSDGRGLKFLSEKGMKTARLGNVAYDIDGKVLADWEGVLPLFIGRHEAELYNDIMMTRTFGPHWRRNY